MTGGSGTLGNAIVDFLMEHQAGGMVTIFSRDPMRQEKMRHKYRKHPFVFNYVVGDVRDRSALLRAMAGHDFVLHLAAMKHIPQAEYDPDACFEINVVGTKNVLDVALIHEIQDVVLISTDKACHPINAYGMSKAMMERYGFAYAETGMNIYMPRYGNVIESTGSVLVYWKKQIAQGKPISVTNPEMTRFWLTPEQSAEIVIESLEFPNEIYVPMLPALSIGKIIEYALEEPDINIVGLRPGEKIHEELLTWEESAFANESYFADTFYTINSPTSERFVPFGNYCSDNPIRSVTRGEMRSMLGLGEGDA